MDVLLIEGEPRQRGQAYGEGLRKRILDLLGQAWEGLGESIGMAPKQFIMDWLTNTNYLEAVDRWTPQLLEEVRGIGEGAGVEFSEIFAWQLLDEFGWYLNLMKSRAASANGIGQCSTLGVFGENEGSALLAQNWDSLTILGEYLTMLHIKNSANGLETFVITSSGRIGPFGMNNQGAGICLNGLTEFLNSSGEGLPVVFVGRGALEQGSPEAAACFVQKVPHATAQSYTVGGPHAIWMYEASANQVLHVPASGTRLVHTNHPFANDDKCVSNRTLEVQQQNWKKTTTRYKCIQNRLADRSKPVTVETVKAILSSHDSKEVPVCRHAGAEPSISTAAGMIMELSSQPVLHLSQAHPCEAEFKRFSFSD
jgi:isopenicillin-N N-acyltransferase like protein